VEGNRKTFRDRSVASDLAASIDKSFTQGRAALADGTV
jgi:hypothetical protein